MTPRRLLAASPVMPVIVIERLESAVPLARALVAGGIRVLEVTLRTPVALDAVRAIRAAVPEALVGIGTVTTTAELDAAIAAGAASRPGLACRPAWPSEPGSTQLKVMSAIEQCRTAALGGHLLRCDGCGTDQLAYNSCRNRHCPKCQSSAAKRWLVAGRCCQQKRTSENVCDAGDRVRAGYSWRRRFRIGTSALGRRHPAQNDKRTPPTRCETHRTLPVE